MKFIGITGGVGAGKSAILSYIKEHFSAEVVLADELAKSLMAPGTDCYREITDAFGNLGVFDADGKINNEKMAKLVFSNQARREQLNGIVHPAVKREVLRQVSAEKQRGQYDYFFFEAALLIEDGYDKLCDELWYIYTDEDHRRQRLKDGRGYSDEKIDSIFASQQTESAFREYAQVVIDNNGEPEEAFRQIQKILHEENDK